MTYAQTPGEPSDFSDRRAPDLDSHLNHHLPQPTPECAGFGDLLPLLATDALTTDEVAATRAHLAGCGWCRAQLDAYAALDALARREYGADAPDARVAPPGLPDSVRVPFQMRQLQEQQMTMRPDDVTQAQLPDDEFTRGPIAAGFDSPTEQAVARSPRPDRSTVLVRRSGRLTGITALAATLLLVILAGILFRTHLAPGGRPTATTTQTPTLQPGADQVFFTHAVPWGVLTINGTTNIASFGTSLAATMPLTLPRGKTTLVYTAAPFNTLRCVISVPANKSDTCPLTQTLATYPGEQATASDLNGPSTPLPVEPKDVIVQQRTVDLGAIPNNLPTAALKSLVAATEQQLSHTASSTEVAIGDHYLGSDGKVAVAKTAFRATLSVAPPTQVASPSNGSETCAPFCAEAGPQPVAQNGWHISFFPVIQWQFAMPGVPVVVQQSPGTGDPIDVAVQWNNSAWKVAVSDTVSNGTIDEIVGNILSAAADPNGSAVGGGASATPLADGVLLLASSGNNNTYEGAVLYRAGVVVVATPGAHTFFPSLPLASAHEEAIAQQLLQQIPASVRATVK